MFQTTVDPSFLKVYVGVKVLRETQKPLVVFRERATNRCTIVEAWKEDNPSMYIEMVTFVG